jgi:hypothetical protein
VRQSHKIKEEQSNKDEQFYSVEKVDQSLEIDMMDLDMNKLIQEKN